MKIRYITFIYLILFASYNTLCGQGCLQCSEDQQDICIICDKSLNYKKVGDSCLQVNIDKCESLDISYNCISCIDPYYPSEDGQSCLLSTTTITNCSQRSAEMFCNVCQENFFPQYGRCLAVTYKQLNCIQYGPNQECQKCSQFYIYSPYFKKCIKKPDTFCQSYEQVECEECEKDFVLKNEENFDLNQISDFFNYRILEKNQFCEQQFTQDPNCVNQDGYSCFSCKQGYFLQDQQCTSFGQSQSNVQQIDYCLHYLNVHQCYKCNVNYYPSNDRTQCIHNDIANNCQNILNDQPGPICLSCNQDQFLFENQCIQRQNYPINNCRNYSIESDKCEQCNITHEFDQTNIFCQPLNCIQFDNTTQLCLKCNNKFYLNNQQCQSGSVSNCLEYEVDQDKCLICDYTDRYELDSSGQCQQTLPVVENCEQQSMLQNSCDQCNKEAITLEINSICEQKNVQNCIQYNQQGGCSQCSGELIPSYDQLQCVQETLKNCQQISDGICQQCQEGYHKHNQVCVKIFPYLQENCLINNLDQNSQISLESGCQICEQNTFPALANSSCINIDFVKLQNYYIPDCISYLFETCIKCKPGKFLSENFTCVDFCPQFQETYIVKIHNQSILLNNYCKSQNETCEIKSISILQKFSEDYIYHCQKCTQNYLEVVQNMNSNSALINSQKTIDNEFQFINFVPKVQCVQQTDQKIIKIVQNCDYYGYIDQSKDQIGCVKCKFGYRDLMQSLIEPDNTQCTEYGNDNICVKCKQGYTLQNDNNCYINFPKSFYANCQEKIPFCEDKKLKGLNDLDLQLFSCHYCQNSANGEKQYPVMAAYHDDLQNTYNMPLESNHLIECMPQSQIESRLNYQLAGQYQFFKQIQKQSGQQIFQAVGCSQNYYPSLQINNELSCQKIDAVIYNEQKNYYGFFDFDWTTQQYKNQTFENLYNPQFIGKRNRQGVYAQNTFLKPQRCVQGLESINDFECIQVSIPGCQKSSQILQTLDFDPVFVLYDLMNDRDYGFGCLQCQEHQGEEMITISGETTQQCHKKIGIEVFPKNFFIKSYYVENCNFHGYTSLGVIECKKCKKDYQLQLNTSNEQICVAYQYPQGCIELTLDQINCEKCETNYVLVNGQCHSNNISNCENYEYQNELQCTKCVQGFYLEENICKQGDIQHCLIYNDDGTCQKCNNPYVLLNPNQCIDFQFSQEFNCDQFGYSGDLQFQCLQCRDLYVEKILDQSILSCLFEQIENCAQYQNSADNLTFQCVQCDENKVLNNGNCQQERVISIQYCQKYNTDSEGCQICQQGSSLLSNGYCDYPNIIENCKIYQQNSQACEQCEDGYILNIYKTGCDQRENIQNCLEYDQNYNCTKCDNQHYLQNNQCYNSSLIENCFTYSQTENLCQICQQGYHLSNQECQKDNENQQPIENCLNHSDIETCEQCNKGYYFDTNTKKCEIVDVPLNNCEFYNNQKECIKCEYPAEFFLNQEGQYYCKQPDHEGCLLSPKVQYFGKQTCLNCTEDYFFYYNKCYPRQQSSFDLCQSISSSENDLDIQVFQECLQSLYIANCDQLGKTSGQCSRCAKGYILFDNQKCIKEQNTNSNCLSKVAGQLECKTCNNGYDLIDGLCTFVDNDSGCQEYDLNGLCKICKFGYYQDQYGICKIN